MPGFNKSFRMRAFLGGTALSLLIAPGLPALAQTDTGDNASEREVVTVTATRREAAVQDTGAAITALTGEEMSERGVSQVEDLQYQVPGLVYGETSGTAQVGIRGVGLAVETGFAEQGVASYIDGVFLPRAGMTNLNFGDIAQVEVLRGPQGTLYGRNATGGIINYITNKPTDAFEAGLKLGYAEYDTYSGQGFVSGPFTDNAQGRLFISASDSDGYIDNPAGPTVGDERLMGGRASLRLIANESFKVDLSVMGLRQDGGYVYNQATNAFGPLYALPGTVLEPNTVLAEIEPDTVHEVGGGILTVSFDIGAVGGKSITSLLRDTRDEFSDSDGVALAITWLDRRETSNSFSQEFNFNGAAFNGGLDWIAGLYYLQESADLNTDVVFFGGPLTLAQNQNEDNKTYGIFTDLTFNLTERLRLIGGARFGRDEKEITFRYSNPLVPTACTGTVEVNLDSFNPKAAVEFDATDDVLLYAQYSRGTKPGGGNISGPTCNDTFDDETIDAFEGGFKSVFAGGAVTLNSSLFYYSYEDYQVFQIIFPSASIVNAEEASVFGVETEFLWTPIDSFTLNAGLVYLNAEYDTFTDTDSFGIVCLIPGQCPTIPFVPSGAPQDLSGNKLTRAPEWTLNLGAENEWSLGSGFFGSFKLRGEAYYTDDLFFRQFNQPWDKQEAYWLFNAFATLESSSERFALRFYAKNLGDEEYVVSQFSNASPLGNSATLGIYGPPRRYGVELAARFGAL